jgi:CubicO group peptidase (beta-lactamase class C family)
VFWLSLLLAGALQAQSRADQVRELASTFFQRNQLNGGVLVVENGRAILKRAHGFSGLDHSDTLSLHTPFNLGEASAQFTALAIAQLQAKGQLSLDDDISQYLSELPYQGLRIRDLLWHSSGLPEYFLICEKHWQRNRPITNQDLLALFQEHEPRLGFPRGTFFEYSNTGYAFLAVIVERVSRQGFASYLEQHIFSPLGMEDAFVYNSLHTPLPSNIPQAYRLGLFKPYVPYESSYLDGIIGDKGVYASLHDLEKWAQALQGKNLLPPQTLQQLFVPGRLNNGKPVFYGMGWVVMGEPEVVYHDGAWEGFRSTIVHYPSLDRTVVLVSNRNDQVVSLQRAFSRVLEGRPAHKPLPGLLQCIRRKTPKP